MYKIETHNHEAKVVICDRCGKRMSDDEPFEGYTIDTCFDLKLKRTPVIQPPSEASEQA